MVRVTIEGPAETKVVEAMPKQTGIVGERRVVHKRSRYHVINVGDDSPLCKPRIGYEDWRGSWDEPALTWGPLLSYVWPTARKNFSLDTLDMLAAMQYPLLCTTSRREAEAGFDRVLRRYAEEVGAIVGLTEGETPAACWNAGLWLASSDYVALVDDASRLDPAAIKEWASSYSELVRRFDGAVIVHAAIAALVNGFRAGETADEFSARVRALASSGAARRVVHILPHLNARGAQVVALRLMRAIDADHTVLAERPSGELAAEFLRVAKVRAWSEGQQALAEADVVHFHWAGWRPAEGLPDEALLVTEHLLNRRYAAYMSGGRCIVPWRCRRPRNIGVLPEEFRPPRVEIANPVVEELPRDGMERQLPDSFVLGVTSAEEYKGIREWLAVAEKAGRKYGMSFVLCGPRRGESCWTLVENRMAELRKAGIDAQCLGYVPHDELAGLYHKAFALLHMSRTESAGLVLIEAQQHGVPVVATAVGGATQHVYNGAVVTVGDVNGAVKALREMMPMDYNGSCGAVLQKAMKKHQHSAELYAAAYNITAGGAHQ